MQSLVKTIEGESCKIYAVKNHRRYFVADAVPQIEVYENRRYVDGANRYKSYKFSLIICSEPKLDKKVCSDNLDGVSHFDIDSMIKRKDGVFVPFEFAGLRQYSIEQFDRWEFEVDCPVITKEMLDF